MTQLMNDADAGEVISGRGGSVGIVLIHALGRSRWSMWLLARRLRAAGWPVAVATYPSQGWGAVHLVGHSLGGLIARALATTRPELRIARVVQMGTPNGGTKVAVLLARWALARWLLGPVLLQVAAFPARVARQAAVGSIAGTGHIGWLNGPLGLDGPNDGVVTVRSAWGGAAARATAPAIHTFLPMSARVARLTAAFLRDGNFDGAQESKR
ncbi:MAG TPA: alpha/beta fold hydrolase [Thermohalobaculum sp.]|nr:alpha/beta fold hydrolase [Thermohalobaculum sp.]